MKAFSFADFRPTILFLVKFIGIYLVGNLLYGVYVSSFRPAPDPATRWVTGQTAAALELTGHPTDLEDQAKKPTTYIRYKERPIVAVYEGCNGINILIIFIAFLVSFGKPSRALLWFIPLGMVIIHIFNLARIGGLFLITLYKPEWLYFTHKYLFTAFIYAVVFVLWFVWVRSYALKTPVANSSK